MLRLVSTDSPASLLGTAFEGSLLLKRRASRRHHIRRCVTRGMDVVAPLGAGTGHAGLRRVRGLPRAQLEDLRSLKLYKIAFHPPSSSAPNDPAGVGRLLSTYCLKVAFKVLVCFLPLLGVKVSFIFVASFPDFFWFNVKVRASRPV